MLIVSGSLATWLGQYFPASSRPFYLMQSVVQATVAFIGTAIITAWIIGRRPFQYLRLTQSVTWRPFLGVVIVYILAMPFLNQLIYYNSLLKLPEALSGIEEYMRDMEDLNSKLTQVILTTDTIGGLITGILIVGVLTGIGEEFLFRGTLQRSLNIDPRFRQWSIWIAAFIFSAVHFQFFGFFPRLLLGAFFGYLLYSTGSLWPAIFAHALNNSIVVVSYWLSAHDGTMTDIDTLWVVKEGFPTTPFISLLATAIFFAFGYKWFFCQHRKGEIDGC